MDHRRILRSLGGHWVFSLELSILQNFFYRLNEEHNRLKEYRISPLQYPLMFSSCRLVDDFNDPLTSNWDNDANDKRNKFEPGMRAFLCYMTIFVILRQFQNFETFCLQFQQLF